jgi:hypothetical protein
LETLKRLWNTEASVGNAVSAVLSAVFAVYVVYRWTDRWLYAIPAALVWSGLFLAWDVGDRKWRRTSN